MQVLHIHHIARGVHRQQAREVRVNLIRACMWCHDAHLDAMPIARQLAIKKKNDPQFYDRVAVNLLRGRQPEAVTEDEVDCEFQEMYGFGAKFPYSRP